MRQIALATVFALIGFLMALAMMPAAQAGIRPATSADLEAAHIATRTVAMAELPAFTPAR